MTSLPNNRVGRILHITGTALVAVSVLVLLVTFSPVIREEIKYQLWPIHSDALVLSDTEAKNRKESEEPVMVPVDEDFGIVIPKIGANARVIADVDWQDARVYQEALVKGVAQARGTALPGEAGNIFLFSHSGVDFLEANRYNALFYLIDKLVLGDEITLFYRGEKFVYQVKEKKKVAPEDLSALIGSGEGDETLTLMTCWPAGTTLKRLVVIASRITTQ
jgi:sortase A